ncbi:xanthine dehydrogenase family protein molybdopterin-binding subunit [Jiulongibacter sediminis]|uniref:Isoquinoline 1-oxidoreductase n=1 Tax=Jiulongibacter sediminis TaxID=1605367 RepID=A0A0P7BZG0_9BACT|nr:molybdopterin cofactor-binding domain-containing protein [Jiulongibacter sediminis]KPM47619.1 isoquinoline 1-oxidoreductase [Jiulongibacter sediminis]TBX23410.1 isoquinoline 1-oxidoreductase [Jiulongibacter sediminis]
MQNIQSKSRRDFLKSASAASGGLILGFSWLGTQAFGAKVIDPSAVAHEFNAYLSISPDGKITIYSPNPEIGQGIKTAFPLIVAEELDVDFDQVTVLQANLSDKYDRQLTGGSGAIRHSWDRLREAGATARELMKEAAAQKWNTSSANLTTAKGMVISPDGKKLSYGDLVETAKGLNTPTNVKLKDPKDFKLIGGWHKGVDNPKVLKGERLFGIDLKKEGMFNAQIQRPPAFGLKLKSFDASEALKMPGIVEVVSFDNKVAIVGNSTWEIMQARKKVKIDWEKDKDLESSEDHDRIFKTYLDKPDNGEVRRKDGDIEKAFAEAAKVVTADYQCPFLPHSPMEPMNFFAHVKENGTIELAGPTQTPGRAVASISKLLDVPADKISVELTKMGGGFGRRLDDGYAVEAAHLSSIIKKPVKVTWTKEDDISGGYYRPAVRYRFRAALDKDGNITGFHLKGVGLNAGNCTRQDNFPAGAIDNLLVESVNYESPITTGPWRAPITNFLAYAEQAFLDEVAEAAKKDPVQLRLELFERAKNNPVGEISYDIDRFVETIKLAAEKASWGKKKNISQGFSAYFSHNSYVAQVAEVKKVKGQPVLSKVIAATDCGIVINQSGAQNQIYGAITDGLGHAMFGKLSFKNGEPEQKNYDSYRIIRMNEIPEIEAHFVNNGKSPTGLGEPAIPPTGGAIANAFAAATGKRLYSQPFNLEDDQVESYL